MARPADWSPVDMESDPTPGDPEEVRELADELQAFSDDVAEALGKIRDLASDRAVRDWAGLSAEAFRSEFDSVPGNLEKLRDSYDLCAQALQTYWPKLQTAQGQADRALDRAIAAQADLTAAQGSLGSAQDWVGRAGDEAERLQREGERAGAPPPDEAEVRAATRDRQAANDARDAAQARVDTAQDSLNAARELARQAKEMREEAAQQAARDIDEASDAGIHNRKWWQRAVHWVTENWDTIVNVCKVIVAVLGVVVMIIGGPLAWVVLAAALVVLADTLIKYARGEAGLLDIAFATLDCIPGMKGLTTLGGLARGMRGLAATGLRGIRQGALRLGRRTRAEGVPMNGRNACGDPVDVATGELLMSATDVELPGVLPLIIERHHISSYRHGRRFGTSWASTLDQRLLLDAHGARLLTADGMTLLYPRPLPGEPVLPVEGPRWTLAWDGRPQAPLTVHQRETGHTLHFAPIPGRPGAELPLIAITDRNNNRIHLAYDNSGDPTDIHHSGGYHIGVTTSQGHVTELRLLNHPEQPTLVRYGHNGAGDLTEIINSSGLPLKFAYDDDHRMTRWEDRNGYWYSYEYDPEGRCVFTTGTDRALEYRYTYDTDNNRTTVTNSLGHDTTYQFNDSYQLTAQTDPLGNTTTHTWDRYDHTLTTTDPLGNTTRHEYDEHGSLTDVVHPDMSRTTAEYDSHGRIVALRKADGALWRQTYDGDALASLTDPMGNRTSYILDSRGALIAVTDPTGATTRVERNPAGLAIAVTDTAGRRHVFAHDAFGRVVEHTDPLGGTRRIERDTDGRPLRFMDPSGGVRTYEWDAEGNLLACTDEMGGVARFTYGAFDLPLTRTETDGTKHTFLRDTELRVTQVRNDKGGTWAYQYDPVGRLVSETDFDGRTVSYVLDASGSLVQRVNALGETVTFTRDQRGNITEKRVENTLTRYAYDPVGRLLSARSTDSELVIDRDASGRVLRETVDGQAVEHSYNPMGRPLTRTTPSGLTSSWAYDDQGRLASLTTAGHVISFRHDALGREVERRVDEHLSIGHTWDLSGRPTAQTSTFRTHRLLRREYDYQPDNLIASVREDTRTTSYGLDATGRVSRVTGPAHREEYRYDGDGNQLSALWTGGRAAEAVGRRDYEGTRITRAGRVRYSYDAAGRTVTRRVSYLSKKPSLWRYSWDAEDRLASVTTPDGTVWRYRYDPLGRRSAKERVGTEGSVEESVRFVWSGQTLIEQETRYAERPGDRAATAWAHDGLRPIAQIEQDALGERFFSIVTDVVGAPSELIDESGAVAWRREATLWGADRSTSRNGTVTPLRFPGQYADAETGWYYNVHRHYDPAIARYSSPDPLGLGPAPNPYGYVSDPRAWVDPLGLAAHPGVDSPAGPGPWDLRGRDPMSVVPDSAEVRELTPHPNGGSQYGLEFKWVDSQSRTVRMRIHGPDGTAPPGSNSASGETFRIQFGQKYQDETGNLYPPGVHKPESSNYNPTAANDTHIPWPSGFVGL
ncbi:polymorphic toxin type 30 domain-containing protein [Streptomyces sp. MS19]|uniref:polymorphic toxin type 30 domain-containing protein n=1 Tax=Streptomyces sp. MS19 TaxID=3385972 RepID=UPI0039A034C2